MVAEAASLMASSGDNASIWGAIFLTVQWVYKKRNATRTSPVKDATTPKIRQLFEGMAPDQMTSIFPFASMARTEASGNDLSMACKSAAPCKTPAVDSPSAVAAER